jgi:hypothetical protein
MPAQDQGLGARPSLGQTTLNEKLVESLTCRSI